MNKSSGSWKKPTNIAENRRHGEITPAAKVNQFFHGKTDMGSKVNIGQTVSKKKIGEIGMGSKRKKRQAALFAAQQKQNQINAYNAGERSRGATLDNNFVAQKQTIVQKEGTVDYKKFLKSRLSDLTNVLGVKK